MNRTMLSADRAGQMFTNTISRYTRSARAHVSARPKRIFLCLLQAGLVLGCATGSRSAPDTTQSARTGSAATNRGTPPTFMLGQFEDDYGDSFSISATDFVQLPRGRFHIVQWNVAQQYFIAQNDSLNRSDPSRWTRIDWVPLSGMLPYTWAFCFSAYNATTRAEAEAALTAKRDIPKTGCGGFPFTRMKPRP